MYKKLIPSLLFIGSAAVSIAQPTLLATNVNPEIGDAFIVHECVTTGVVPGSAGAGVSWNFSTLQTNKADTGTAITPGAASASTFPGSNIAIITPSASATIYYITSSTKLSQNGVYTSAAQYATYTNPMDQLHFPLSYLDTFTDPYAGSVYYTTSGIPIAAGETGTIAVTADAYGTLTLPGISSPVVFTNVLRVHSLQSYRDSANLFGTPAVETYTLETYTWYTPGYHNALLTISTATGLGVDSMLVSYSYAQTAFPAAVSSTTDIAASLTLFPNPAKDDLNIRYSTTNSENVRISLSDMLGRQVAVIADKATQGRQQLTYNTAALAKGMYLIRLQSATETVTRKVEVQ